MDLKPAAHIDDLTFIHELGHNLGCQHDRGNSGTTEGRFPYSYGYQDPDRAFRTVMAYNCIGGCPRIQYFSNPDLSYQARPVGISEIYPNAANNAKTINSTRVGMAAYRASSTPFIQVNSPNGGESWRIGKTYPITWKASNLDSYVTIELYQAGILQSPALASGIPNAGTYTWFISSQFSPGADYSIRVKGDASGATIFDDSDHSFTLISIRRSPQAMPWIDLLLRDP